MITGSLRILIPCGVVCLINAILSRTEMFKFAEAESLLGKASPWKYSSPFSMIVSKSITHHFQPAWTRSRFGFKRFAFGIMSLVVNVPSWFGNTPYN